MEHFKDKLKFAIMRESNNVQTSGVSPLTLLAGYYVSRKLPFNIHELNDVISFNRSWEALMPTATEMLKELGQYAVFGEMRALHYTKRFFEYRATQSSNVWVNLWDVFGYTLFKEGGAEEEYNGTMITEEDKVAVITNVSESFTVHSSLVRSTGYVSAEIVSKTYAERLDKNLSRTKRKYMMETGIDLISKCIRIQMWSSGHNKQLTDAYRPFLRNMFNYVENGCVVDESLNDFVIKHSVSNKAPVAHAALNLY